MSFPATPRIAQPCPSDGRSPGTLRVGRIALVADRGLISEENLVLVQANGFDHVLATRLHRERPSPRSWRPPPTNRPSSCPSETTGPKRPRSSMNHAAMSWSIPPRHVRDDAGAKSSSPRPKTDSSPCQNACARAASSTRPRSVPQPTGSSGLGVSRCFRPRSPRGVHLGLRREGHGLRGETPRRPLCDHDLARQQDRLDRPGRRSLQESSVSRTALSRAEGLLRVDSIIIT